MINIGKTNTLTVVKKLDFGVYLDGGEAGEILLPQKYVPTDAGIGDDLRVFIYRDSNDRLIATTERPLIEVGEFGYLKAVSTTKIGVFMDWGLLKDLLVPFREQKRPMNVGEKYIVYAFLDHATDRIVGSTKLDKFLGNKIPHYEEGDKVRVLVVSRTDLGMKVIVDDLFWGMIYNNDLFDPIDTGDRVEGYVKLVRSDGKIDVTLRSKGGERVFHLADRIIGYLEDCGGRMNISDSSTPEDIKNVFQCSKKDFKKSLGLLYKKGSIIIGDNFVELTRR